MGSSGDESSLNGWFSLLELLELGGRRLHSIVVSLCAGAESLPA